MMRERWPMDHVKGGERVFQAERKSKYMAPEMGMENSGGK